MSLARSESHVLSPWELYLCVHWLCVETILDIRPSAGPESVTICNQCGAHGFRCQLRQCLHAVCACRRCLMSSMGEVSMEMVEQGEEIIYVSAELHDHE